MRITQQKKTKQQKKPVGKKENKTTEIEMKQQKKQQKRKHLGKNEKHIGKKAAQNRFIIHNTKASRIPIQQKILTQQRSPIQKTVQKLFDITEGTVIDHIPAGSAFMVLRVLGIQDRTDCMVSVGTNLESKKHGKKDLLKVEGKHLTKQDLDRLALIAPGATINHISNTKVKNKFLVEVPVEFIGVLNCANPSCISTNQNIPTRFHTIKYEPLKLQCHYCERFMDKKQITLYQQQIGIHQQITC